MYLILLTFALTLRQKTGKMLHATEKGGIPLELTLDEERMFEYYFIAQMSENCIWRQLWQRKRKSLVSDTKRFYDS